ncbi:tyrosine-type recombinase/integrase [Arsenicicoccus dermatophilus]|uniref:tyrosine-type recombinase/integrase n=1 Tax=Arsenicicoccus dermatophilus TaxID=1076331 RepID=UPI001F4C9C82|nr:site-specific integrase [Arsenicicoccus dermatophilus]MCH8611787.1 site-specific integrase [Arsenicicoccus dermatophilus]
MASIAKRPDGRWRARYRDDTGREHARHFARKVDARRWLDEVTASVVTGQYVDPRSGRMAFRAFYDTWAASQDWAPRTTEAAALALASVTFADLPIRSVTEQHVRDWMKAMQGAQGLAATTRRTRFNYVRMAFLAAVRQRVIPTDPTAGVKPPQVPKAEGSMRVPTSEQVGRALDAADELFRPFVAVCAFAGLRLGEAAGLQLGDVDFLRRTITVRRQVQGCSREGTSVTPPKCGSVRTVPAPSGLVTLLAQHVEWLGLSEADEWLIARLGVPYNRSSAGDQWRRVRAKAGLHGFTLHDLRHHYASGLIAAGCDVVTVQHALGHSSPSITLDVYSHLWPKADDRTRAAAADLMSAALGDSADSVRTAAAD